MNATPDNTLTDPEQIIADLQRQLAECKAERDECKAERNEALQRETATAEVLQVINSSSGNLALVFDAMLEKAMRLCEIAFGLLFTRDDEYFHAVAARGLSPALAEYLRHPFTVPPGSTFDELVAGVSVVQIPDVGADDRPAVDTRRALVELGGARTGLAVALRKDDEFLGAFWFYRQEVHPFTDEQVSLLQNFAAQAVIAMENARMLTETREALEQQTATAEVLQVINSSPGDLAPVFDAILEKAHTLCGVAQGALVMFDGEVFRASATRGLEDFASVLREGFRPSLGSPQDKLLNGEPLVHISDAGDTDDPTAQRGFELAGIRTVLYVAMRKDRSLLGYIAASRKEVRPFSDKQIVLLQAFADQAVIAIENARLLTETREALEHQTATAEVLRVINGSPGNLGPVFDAMLERAVQLCDSSFGSLHTFDGEEFHSAATRFRMGTDRRFVAHTLQPDPGSGLAQVVGGASVVHIPDVADTDEYRGSVAPRVLLVEHAGARAVLWVALRKHETLLGVFTIYRREVRPFTDRQIALVQNFAAQAVIAIENARLIAEQWEALEQQTATAEVLRIINASPGNLAPVFDAMLAKAMRLCEASFGSLWTLGGDRFRPVAHHGLPPPYAEYLRREVPPAGPGTGRARLLAGERYTQILDLADDVARLKRPGLARRIVG